MTSYGSGPINAIHKAIQILCLGWNPIKSFLSEYPQRASCWAPSGNNHKCQISCVSTSKAETRQEHENRRVQPFNQAQKRKKETEKTFQWLSGRSQTHFLVQLGLLRQPSGSGSVNAKVWPIIHWHTLLWRDNAILYAVKSGRDSKLSLNLPFDSTNPLESTPWNL